MSDVVHLVQKEEGLEKVFFKLDDDWHGYSTESVWAQNVGSDQYKVRNVPYYVKNVSVEDVVAVQKQDSKLFFSMVSKRAGHSTYRIMLDAQADDKKFGQYWNKLEEIGCTYERGQGSLYAMDVPSETNIYKTYEFLEVGEKDGIWDFEEGHCGHPID